jgi:deoxyinosine 3'endonuclease (endonuclease V)
MSQRRKDIHFVTAETSVPYVCSTLKFKELRRTLEREDGV